MSVVYMHNYHLLSTTTKEDIYNHFNSYLNIYIVILYHVMIFLAVLFLFMSQSLHVHTCTCTCTCTHVCLMQWIYKHIHVLHLTCNVLDMMLNSICLKSYVHVHICACMYVWCCRPSLTI